MQLRFSLAFSNIFLITLIALLTWTSLAQGPSIAISHPLCVILAQRLAPLEFRMALSWQQTLKEILSLEEIMMGQMALSMTGTP
ncbi:hypothetical protein OG21DRAFT_943266 [Imleria badia]|nr:hypothetical protein OG21DRAFT_943266 [Imleria badia]